MHTFGSVYVAAFLPIALLFGCASESTELPSAVPEETAMLRAHRFGYSAWSPPVRLGDAINTAANEQGPTFSPDGETLYFCSNRSPGGQGGNDIWVSRRVSESEWGAPVNLGSTINSAGGDCGPNISPDGHLLFFTSNREGGPNQLYVSRRRDRSDDLAWEAPQPLGPAVNSTQFEFSPFYSLLIDLEDGPMNLYFDRGPTNAATDIYAAWIGRDGHTTGLAEPVTELNSAAGDAHATVRFDVLEVFLHSNRSGVNFDIYVATRGSIHDPWPAPAVVAALSVPEFHEIHPSLSLDGRRIVFVRGIGTANDIWMSVRESRFGWPSGDR